MTQVDVALQTIELDVQGMTCASCAARIEKKLNRLEGVKATVNYATANGTATTADSDYTAITTTPLTFAPGTATQTVTVLVNGDTAPELNETFSVLLSGEVGATPPSTGSGMAGT